MTSEEYEVRSADLFQKYDQVPPEFVELASCWAWEHGHSAGYDEIFLYLSEFAYGLNEAFKKYNKRDSIRKEPCPWCGGYKTILCDQPNCDLFHPCTLCKEEDNAVNKLVIERTKDRKSRKI